MMLPTIWYIHGAGASQRSFNWLKNEMPQHHAKFLNYSTTEPLLEIVERFSKIPSNEPVILVGHSFGGLVALGMHNLRHVKGIVTMCSPFDGLATAPFMSMLSNDHLFRDLNPYGSTISALHQIVITKPMLSIVATQGLPIMNEINDGVVSLSSATALKGPMYLKHQINHFEVLLDDNVAKNISEFVRKI